MKVRLPLLIVAAAVLVLLGGCRPEAGRPIKTQSSPPGMVAILPGMIEDQSWNKTKIGRAHV